MGVYRPLTPQLQDLREENRGLKDSREKGSVKEKEWEERWTMRGKDVEVSFGGCAS